MDVKGLRLREQRMLANDGKITAAEAKTLVAEAKKAWTPALKRELKALLSADPATLDPVARRTVEDAVGVEHSPKPAPLLASDVIRTYAGAKPGDFSDDVVYLGKDGTVSGSTGLLPYTRSNDPIQSGPLRTAHGSPAPESTVLTANEVAALRSQSSGDALDAAVTAFGVDAGGFDALAHSSEFFKPDGQYWEGKCHAWSWASLNKTIDDAVDVKGPDNQKGVWLAGQWLSRADLGNWMMAVADTISIDPSQTKAFKKDLSAEDIVKGATQFMMNASGGGVVADVWNDKREGSSEIWNRPFYAADIQVTSLKGAPEEALIERAKKDGVEFAAHAKLLAVTGHCAQELNGGDRGDRYEGDPNLEARTWNIYAVTDATGKMVKAYMADDETLGAIAGLPEHQSAPVPDYFWKPTLNAVQDVIEGKRNDVVERDPLGPQFKFFVGTVLKSGVPGTVRTDFEKAFAALPPGPVSPSQAEALAAGYPGVANAYSPQQWAQAFASRGLDALTFGAKWPVATSRTGP